MLKKRKAYSFTYKNPKVLTNKRRVKKSSKSTNGILRKLVKAVAFVLLIILLIFLLNNDYTKIKKIEIKNKDNFTKRIEEITKDYLGKKSLYLVANSSYMVFNSNSLENDIKKSIPEIKTINITKKFPDTINIEATLHEASIGWETQGKKYLLNEDGYLLKETENLDNIIAIKDSSNLPVKDNNRVVYPNFIYFVKQINQKLSALAISATSFEISETTFIVNVRTSGGYRIVFDTTKNLDDQINKLNEAIKYLGSNILNLDYIDVTVKNKAIYKTK